MTLATRLAIAMILLVAIAVTAVGWLSQRSLEQALLPRVLDRIESHSQLVAADLQSSARGARTDIATFPSHAAVHGMVAAHLNGGIDPVDHVSEAAWRERLQTRFSIPRHRHRRRPARDHPGRPLGSGRRGPRRSRRRTAAKGR
jgi:hypothetical protein